MKKSSVIIAFAGLMVCVATSFADVQNILLKGDIRIRGYYLRRADALNESDSAFISQRTRLTMESDLDDNVLAVVSLAGESLWGGSDEPLNTSGAGASFGQFNQISRRFDMGVTEGYVQLKQVFSTPATLKVGRQYLHYGNGMILSSVDDEYNHDAIRLIMDYYPLTIDVVYAHNGELMAFGSERQTIYGAPLNGHAIDMVFVNAHRDFANCPFKNIEVYGGSLMHGEVTGTPRIPPSDPYYTYPGIAATPWIVGVRSDLNLADSIAGWVEGVYEGGTDGDAGGRNINAWLANAGLQFSMKNYQWTPVLRANYIYASGGGEDGRDAFRPWFDYMEGYNGYLFCPTLSNIHIFNLGGSIKPAANLTCSVQGYYYLKADRDTAAFSNFNIDFGGLGFIPTPDSRELGWEIDGIIGYDYSKDVRCQLVYGAFIPGPEFVQSGYGAVAHAVRCELNVRF